MISDIFFRIESAMVISRLVIFLFHPLTQDNVRLRQVLNVFFPFFASMSVANQQQLEDAFLVTVKTIQKAPCTSPLAEIDLSMVVKLFVDLTHVRFLRSTSECKQIAYPLSLQESVLAKKPDIDHNIHDQLALKLGQQALRNPDTGESKVYMKALLQLNMSFSNPSNTRDVHTLAKKLLGVVKDKTCLKLVEQFESLVSKRLPEPAIESNAESTADEAEETVPSSLSARKLRIRQLGSKAGTTLLMDVTGSDADMSQGSPNVFFSPPVTSTQRLRSSSDGVRIELYSRYSLTNSNKERRFNCNFCFSTSTTAHSPDKDKPPAESRDEMVVDNDDTQSTSTETSEKQVTSVKRGRHKKVTVEESDEDARSASTTSTEMKAPATRIRSTRSAKKSREVTKVDESDDDPLSTSASSGERAVPPKRRTRSSIKSQATNSDEDKTKIKAPAKGSKSTSSANKSRDVTKVDESDDQDALSTSTSSGEKAAPPKRRTRSSIKSDVANSDEDVLPPTPPQRPTRSTRKITKR